MHIIHEHTRTHTYRHLHTHNPFLSVVFFTNIHLYICIYIWESWIGLCIYKYKNISHIYIYKYKNISHIYIYTNISHIYIYIWESWIGLCIYKFVILYYIPTHTHALIFVDIHTCKLPLSLCPSIHAYKYINIYIHVGTAVNYTQEKMWRIEMIPVCIYVHMIFHNHI